MSPMWVLLVGETSPVKGIFGVDIELDEISFFDYLKFRLSHIIKDRKF